MSRTLRDGSDEIDVYSFLFAQYLPRYWYFSVIDSFRRVMFTCMLLYLSVFGQIVVALTMALAFVVFYRETVSRVGHIYPIVPYSSNRPTHQQRHGPFASFAESVLGQTVSRIDFVYPSHHPRPPKRSSA